MPRDSNWKIATVLPDENTWYVAGSSSGIFAMSKSAWPSARMLRSASAMIVSVVQPEEVELDQPDLLDVVLVELADHAAEPSAT